MAQPGAIVRSTILQVVASEPGDVIPWPRLLQGAVWCQNVTELADQLHADVESVRESIEALTLVETDCLGEMFRLRELAAS